MRRMGRKRMTIELQAPVDAVPEALARLRLTLGEDGHSLEYAYDRAGRSAPASPRCCATSPPPGWCCATCSTREDSLEDIFVGLVREGA